MRIFLRIFFLFASAGLSQVALAQGQKDLAVDPVAQAISTQIQVTRQNLMNVMNQLDKINTSSVYNDPDYNRMVPAFKNTVNLAMEKYDLTMSTVILPKAQKWLSEFKLLAEPNKDNLEYLTRLAESTTLNLRVVNKLYLEAVLQILKDVLAQTPSSITSRAGKVPSNHCGIRGSKLTGRDLVFYDFSDSEISHVEGQYCSDENYYYDLSGNRVNSQIVEKSVLGQQINSTWAAGCKTDECFQLRLNDLLSFVDLVDSVINSSFSLLKTRYLINNRYNERVVPIEFSLSRSGTLVKSEFREAIADAMSRLK